MKFLAPIALASVMLAACGAAPAPSQGVSLAGSELGASARELPLKRAPWSRLAQTDKDGFYHLPAALCDDYPEESTTPEKIRRDLEICRDTGVKQLRFAFGWDSIEEEPGEYNWGFWDTLVELAPQYGVTLIPYVCYTPRWLGSDDENFWREAPNDPKAFGRFMHAIASRYKGKIPTWELWNEPDLEAYWLGSVDQFAEMVIEGAKQVKKADPAAAVVLGGMANGRGPFFDTLMTKHRLGRYVDVINVHGYLETWGQDRAEVYPQRLKDMNAMIRKTGGGADLWMAEFGYSNWRFSDTDVSQWGIDAIYAYEHTPEYQATALFKHHVLALASKQLSLMAWYRINDLPPNEGVIGDDNNKFLGIVDTQGKPKPAYHAMKFYNRLFDQPARGLDERLKVITPNASQSVVHAFEEKDGTVTVVGWLRSSERHEVADKSGKAADKRQELVSVMLPSGGYKSVKYYDAKGKSVRPKVKFDGQTLRGIPLTGDRVFVAELRK